MTSGRIRMARRRENFSAVSRTNVYRAAGAYAESVDRIEQNAVSPAGAKTARQPLRKNKIPRKLFIGIHSVLPFLRLTCSHPVAA